MGYKQEIDALGRWVYKTAGLRSHRLSSAPPKVARPVILWESPNRRQGRYLGRYSFIRSISQYGTLYVDSLDQLAEVLDKLEKYLADYDNMLPLYESESLEAAQVGWLKQVELDVNTAQSVNIPIIIKYEATIGRPRPEEMPSAIKVVTNLNQGAVTNGE
ncbi:hypothetical protein [Cytobacillus kochii]|uniref:hypothetical protein n=1 Tax=Cytobacillus kochii TaxID=859143 RepID=UPI00402AF62E